MHSIRDEFNSIVLVNYKDFKQSLNLQFSINLFDK